MWPPDTRAVFILTYSLPELKSLHARLFRCSALVCLLLLLLFSPWSWQWTWSPSQWWWCAFEACAKIVHPSLGRFFVVNADRTSVTSSFVILVIFVILVVFVWSGCS